jgi:hypothetical protein
LPPICITRPNLPQCEPGQSQTQELPLSEESFPEATQQPPSEGDNSSIDGSTGDGATTITSTDPNVLDQDSDGYSPNTGDCDDSNLTIFPGATEVANGIDDNCDRMIDNTLPGSSGTGPNVGNTTTA